MSGQPSVGILRFVTLPIHRVFRGHFVAWRASPALPVTLGGRGKGPWGRQWEECAARALLPLEIPQVWNPVCEGRSLLLLVSKQVVNVLLITALHRWGDAHLPQTCPQKECRGLIERSKLFLK